MPMTLRAKLEPSAADFALISASCVALATNESTADVIRFRAAAGNGARGHVVDVRSPRVGEQTWE